MLSDPRQLAEAMAAPAALAAFGGAARALRFGVKSWRQFAASMVLSAFSGVLVHLFIMDSSLAPSFQAGLVAVSGYSGGCILDALQATLVQAIRNHAHRSGTPPAIDTTNDNDRAPWRGGE